MNHEILHASWRDLLFPLFRAGLGGKDADGGGANDCEGMCGLWTGMRVSLVNRRRKGRVVSGRFYELAVGNHST